MAEAQKAPTILREHDVAHMTGLPRSTRYLLIKNGEFPAPVALGSRVSGWMSDEIQAWIDSRRENRSIKQGKPWTPYIEQTEEKRP